MTQTVKLAKLKRSEKNVRTTPPKNIEAMAASIRARGIMEDVTLFEVCTTPPARRACSR